VSDRVDRLVLGAIGAAALAALVAAAVVPRPALGPDAARRWIALDGVTVASRHVLHRTYTVDEAGAAGAHAAYAGAPVDLPRGAALGLAGWALDPDTRSAPDRVLVRLDGGPWRPARSHLPRPDVARAFALPDVGDAGFAAEIPAAALPPGEHAVELATATGAGRPQPLGEAIRVRVR
jgi:hypothetical protein